MTDDERKLLNWVGELSKASPTVNRLSSVLLADGVGTGLRGARSTLNNDGSPLQVCATYGRSRRKIRIIGDPGAFEENQEQRFANSHHALMQLLTLNGPNGLTRLCEETLRLMLPPCKSLDEFRAGIFWLAAGLEGGAALYVNTRWGEAPERWLDAGRWLQTILPERGQCDALLRAVKPHAALASIGLEGKTPEDARAKLYWRLAHTVSLDQMGVPLLSERAFQDFLLLLLSEEPLALSGLVLSAGFRLADGMLSDVKIDVCAHCLPRAPDVWVDLLERYSQARGLLSPDVCEGMLGGQCELAFVGFGIDTAGNERLNLYLKAQARDN